MENKLTRFMYEHSPDFMKNVYVSIAGWQRKRQRFGPEFERWKTFYEASHRWSEAELREYRREKLSALISHAYEHVPYYAALFKRLGLRPSDLTEPEDLQKLPILQKQDVIDAGPRLFSDAVPRKSFVNAPTSGSTGTPLALFHVPCVFPMEYGFEWARARPGVSLSDPFSAFSGWELVDPNQKRPPFWRDNWAAKERLYSVFHLNDENLQHYVGALDEHYSKYWQGYTSPVYLVADYLERTGQSLARPPDFYFPGSEELQPAHAETITRVLGCKIYNRYHQQEMVASITEYPCGHLHEDMDYSVVEFLPAGQEEGLVKAEVIGTNLHNYGWPLIRYRTGDLVLYDPSDRCEHGVPGRIVRRIYGRSGRYFTLPDGRRITNISVIAKKCRNVRFMQVVQEREGEITVRVVKADGYGPEDERYAEYQFRRKVGDEIGIRFEYVDTVERTAAGKYISIVNRLEDPK